MSEPNWKSMAMKAYMTADHMLGHMRHQDVCTAMGICECGMWKAEKYFLELRNLFGKDAPKLLYPERENFMGIDNWPTIG